MSDSRQPNPDLPILIRRAQAGDTEAFDGLARSLRDRIFRWALVRTGDGDDAEDATQEALVRLYLGLRRFRGDSSFETWLYSITRSASMDVIRRRNRRKRMKDRITRLAGPGPRDPEERAVAGIEAGRSAALLRVFLQDLPARQREALYLVDVEGLDPGEAAARLGANSATLRTHLFRARRTLRARLLKGSAGGME